MLILADGTIIENGSAGMSDEFLWLWLPGWTMMDAAQKVFNPAAMQTIIYQHGEGNEDIYTGYTVCLNLTVNNGEIAIRMAKG